MTTLQTGALLHQQRYRIRQPLGRGGMGAVYLAEDLNLAGRLVAVKENLNNSEEAQRQFRREAVLLANLRHPNLPQVIDFFVDARGRQYLVMEYVPGKNMQEVIAAQGALPIDAALDCIDQVMQAVAYMHRQRDPDTGRARAIIHRDIKPANIKRTPEERYVLVDFGIAKAQSATAAVTAVSARALTPGYAPIEQYHGGTDERSDVYALGATLYALVTGKAPPSATNMAAGAPLPSPRAYNSKIPAHVSKVVERAMRMAAQERYQGVAEMYQALFNRPVPTTPRTGSIVPAARHLPRPDRTVALAVVGIGVVTVAAIWWLLASSSSATTVASPTPSPSPIMQAATPAVLAAAIVPAMLATATSAPGAPAATPLMAHTTLQLAVPVTRPAALATSPPPQPTVTPPPVATELPTAQPATVIPSPEATLLPAVTLTAAPAIVAAERSGNPRASPRATSTPLSTATLMLTATTVPAATQRVTPSSRPANAANTTPRSRTTGAGPTLARILSPPDLTAVNVPLRFAWEPDQPLAPGQEFEVIFWRINESEATGRGWVRSGVASSVVIDPLDAPVSETSYRWAVYLVSTQPYTRLRRLSEVRTFIAGALNPVEDLEDGRG